MRHHDPDALTSRDREVLELLRRDFTNEHIAQTLGDDLVVGKHIYSSPTT